MPFIIVGLKNIFYFSKILKKDNPVFLISTFCPWCATVPVTERVMCNICGASLMSQAYLDRHIKSRHSNDPLVCNECEFVTDSRKKMRDHGC